LIAGTPSNNPYQFRGSATDATGLRRSSGGSGPNWDPISVTQLDPIPMMIPFNQPYDQIAPNSGDPDDPSRSQGPSSQSGGPEGGRKSEDGGPGGNGDDQNKPSGGNKPDRPKPGRMNGPFLPESEWSKSLDAYRDDIAYWKNVADWGVWGLSKLLDGLTGRDLIDGVLRGLGAPSDPMEAATDMLRIPTSPSDWTKIMGEMMYNGSSLTRAVSTVMQQKSCFVCF